MNILTSLGAETWHEYLGKAPEANIFQTPEMYDIFSSTKNYNPLFVALEDDGVIKGLMLASLIRESGKLKSSLSSRVVVTGGPLTSEGNLMAILDAFDGIAKSKALYAQIRNMWDVSHSHVQFEAAGFQYEEHVNYLHDLTRPLNEIWASFSNGRKKGIKKAEVSEVTIREGEKEDLGAFYDILDETYSHAKVPLADITLFESAFRILRGKGSILFPLAIHDKEIVAGRIILCYRGTLHDWYAGSSEVGRDLKTNELLVWWTIQHGRANGYLVFDFGGAGRLGERYGPGEFKRRFGGNQTEYGRYMKVYQPMKYKIGKKGYDLLRKIG